MGDSDHKWDETRVLTSYPAQHVCERCGQFSGSADKECPKSYEKLQRRIEELEEENARLKKENKDIIELIRWRREEESKPIISAVAMQEIMFAETEVLEGGGE